MEKVLLEGNESLKNMNDIRGDLEEYKALKIQHAEAKARIQEL